mgnify:CR=1 FL=1
MLAAFLQQIGQVKVIAVKMDQVGILRCEGEELVKQCRFVFRAVPFSAPLSHIIKSKDPINKSCL